MREEGKGGASRIALRVRYAKTDQMGVVYYANYPVWFEVGRAGFLRDRGLAYADLEREGFRLPVSGVRYRLLAPARYDELLVLTTRVVRTGAVRIDHAYELRRKSDSALIATAETTVASVNREGKMIPIPPEVAR